jgi:hypothetical protein
MCCAIPQGRCGSCVVVFAERGQIALHIGCPTTLPARPAQYIRQPFTRLQLSLFGQSRQHAISSTRPVQTQHRSEECVQAPASMSINGKTQRELSRVRDRSRQSA